MENNIISKELLSEILNKNITDLEICLTSTSRLLITTVPNSVVYITDDSEYAKWINIHELASKCKEWLISNRYVTHSIRNLKEYIVYLSGDFKIPSEDFRANTEPEAIFNACEWVLNAK